MQDLKVTGLQATSTGLPRRTRLGRDSVFWLILVSAAFLAAELTPALLRMPLGADEITYIARTSAHASGVSLPPVHGQGAGLLAAPVTLFTNSLTAIRVWMSVLSAIGLFLSVLCWRGLRPMWVLALGALIFAGLAISQNSGVQVYPDWWGGLAVLALTGLFLQTVRGTLSNWVVLPAIAFVSLVIVLMRPQNIVFLMAPVILATLVVRRWRKLRVLLAMAVGIALGCLEWVAGAYIWYGGLFQRVQLAGQEPPAFRLYFSMGTQVKVLNGPWYCIPPGCRGWAAPAESPWWAGVPGDRDPRLLHWLAAALDARADSAGCRHCPLGIRPLLVPGAVRGAALHHPVARAAGHPGCRRDRLGGHRVPLAKDRHRHLLRVPGIGPGHPADCPAESGGRCSATPGTTTCSRPTS